MVVAMNTCGNAFVESDSFDYENDILRLTRITLKTDEHNDLL